MSLLGIDLGTSGCKAGVFELDGTSTAQAYREYKTIFPQPGWAELDSRQVWEHVKAVICEVNATHVGTPITALCTSSFGEAFVPVTRDRRFLDSSILCVDDRGKEHSDRLAREIGQERFFEINPNLIGPSFSMPKMLWLRDNRPEVYEQADYFLLWSDLVAFMLGCDPVTNNSHANRTMLFDLRNNDWSDELIQWAGIPRDKLGPVVPGGAIIGIVSDTMADELGLPRNVQVVAGGHDQCCNALGCGAVEAGRTVSGMGTFECITPVYGEVRDLNKMLDLRLNVEHHVLPGLYVSFLFNQSGSLVKWFRDTFAAHENLPEGANVYDLLTAEMPADPTRLLVLPHFEAPVWPEFIGDSAGAIVGLHTNSTRGEILKAIMECATLYFVDSIASLGTLGIETEEFVASGGGAQSDAWLQIKADIFGVPFVRPAVTEAGVLGAAMLAGLGTKVLTDPAQAAALLVRRDRVFEPDPKRHAFYREKHELYTRLFPALHPLLAQM